MKRNKAGTRPLPGGKAGKILINLLVTLVVGAVYFYVSLPAINPQSGDFYSFVFLLCVVYVLCALVTSGFQGKSAAAFSKGRLRDYLKFIRQQCLPVGILLLAMAVVVVVG